MSTICKHCSDQNGQEKGHPECRAKLLCCLIPELHLTHKKLLIVGKLVWCKRNKALHPKEFDALVIQKAAHQYVLNTIYSTGCNAH